MMKCLIILLGVIGCSFAGLDIPDHLKAPLRVLRKACIAESGVAEEHIINSKNGNLPNVPELKCYVLCLLEHSGMIEEDGRIHWEQVMHLLPDSNQQTALMVTDTCKTKHGNTRCETAYETVKCYFEAAPEGAELP